MHSDAPGERGSTIGNVVAVCVTALVLALAGAVATAPPDAIEPRSLDRLDERFEPPWIHGVQAHCHRYRSAHDPAQRNIALYETLATMNDRAVDDAKGTVRRLARAEAGEVELEIAAGDVAFRIAGNRAIDRSSALGTGLASLREGDCVRFSGRVRAPRGLLNDATVCGSVFDFEVTALARCE